METLILYRDYHDNVSKKLYRKAMPQYVEGCKLELYNDRLAMDMDLPVDYLKNHGEILAGNMVMDSWTPIAQGYNGHQFGYYTTLGDGRAILLGEHKHGDVLWDIVIKGGGKTPYSRGGDGRGTISSMYREYIVSEGMHHMGIPTTRSLGVCSCDEMVIRRKVEPMGILTRVSKSHVRVGTFQLAKEKGEDVFMGLTQYVINRHFPWILDKPNSIELFIREVITRQASLIAKWMGVGFIHGVMNTDNALIIGETIDYGPCAFMEIYDPDQVYSSTDRTGRYRYRNQPFIGQWNMARFAELFIDSLPTSVDESKMILSSMVDGFMDDYRKEYSKIMARKLGFDAVTQVSDALVHELLGIMETNRLDYTNTFVYITRSVRGDSQDRIPLVDEFVTKLKKSYIEEKVDVASAIKIMESNNPIIIPRNMAVENALYDGCKGDLAKINELLEYINQPYDYDKIIPKGLTTPMTVKERIEYKTYCGT